MIRLRPRARPAVALAMLPLLSSPLAQDPWPSAGAQEDRITAVHADSATILEDLRYLSAAARGGRAPLTDGSVQARARVADVFAAAGVLPFDGGYERPFARPDATAPAGVNVVGWVPGTEEGGGHIVVTAHFDHMGTRNGQIFNGADDNASGTAALLFLARHLAERPLNHPVILAALDTEEAGLVGARALVAEPPVPLPEIAFNLNMDMLSRGGGEVWAAGASQTPALRPILEGVAAESAATLRLGHDRPGVPDEMDWTFSSDHGAFHEAGIPWVYFGVEDHPDVHAPTDDFERVDPGHYLDAIRTVLLARVARDDRLTEVTR